MRRMPSRGFAIAALVSLVAAAGVAWEATHPPWRKIQRERLEQQRTDARAAVERERGRLAQVQTTLPYRRASEAVDNARTATLDPEYTQRMTEIAERSEELQQRRREIAGERMALEESGREALTRWEALRLDYVRLSGTAGVTEGDLVAWLIENEAPEDGPVARLARADRLARAVDLELTELENERRARERPLTEAENVLAAHHVERDRAQARLERLEGTVQGIREMVTPAAGIERCTTCHPGMDDLTASHADLESDSPYQGWGCTVCHGGNGRALTTDDAHRHLTLRPWSVGDEYTLEPVIALLESADRRERADAAAFLRRLTGREFGFVYHAPREQRSDAVRHWRTWWLSVRGFFRPPYPDGLEVHGHDSSGRRDRAVGSGSCLRCHEVRQRRHVERWRSTKFRTFARLDEVDDPTPCLRCHTTGYDPVDGSYVQQGVTCEGCHGPGGGYGAAMEAAVRLQAAGAEAEGEQLLDEVSTELRQRMAATNVCVECHDPFGVKDLAFEHMM